MLKTAKRLRGTLPTVARIFQVTAAALLVAAPALAADGAAQPASKSPALAVLLLAVFILLALANLAVFRSGRRRWLTPPGRVEGAGFGAYGGGFGGWGAGGPRGERKRHTFGGLFR